jgi:putative nucleotidyltransferase with HDIG domain
MYVVSFFKIAISMSANHGYTEESMNKELEKTIMAAGDLPTIPAVAMKVMQLIESERTTAEELGKIVSGDPAVAARVLKISNSSFYGCQRKIQSLPAAIMMLGFNTLRSLVITASVKQVYQPYGLVEKMLWEHSFGAGLAARIISLNTRRANEEEAFLSGLFHDIGKIIMNFLDRDKFRIVMERCYNEGLMFTDVEKEVYPYTHDEVGACVIVKWNFPEALADSVKYHHSLALPEDTDPYVVNLAAVVNLADIFCLKLGIGGRSPDEDIPVSESESARLLKLDEHRINAMLAEFQESYENDKGYFITE